MREQLAQKRRNMEELRVQLEQKRIDALRAKVEKDTEIIQQEKEKPTTDLFMEECSALEKVSDTQKQSLDKKMKLFDQLNSKTFSADNFPEERDDTFSARRNRTVSFSDDPFSHLDKPPKAHEKEAPSTIKDGLLHYGNAFLYLGELICPPGTTTFLSQHPSIAVGKELEQDELLRYQREGRGALYTVDASGRRLLHDGEWKGDRKEGKGRTTLPTGAHLEGKWSADRVTGTAKFRGENGLRGMLHTNTEGKDALMCSLDRESIRFVGEADLHLDPTTESGEACTLGSGVYQLKSAAYVEWITKEGKGRQRDVSGGAPKR
ncbi:hypothetical protein AGDE_13633 [Angomonas deanei]|nr:hypothetical protein AGDE_13633 [Angomonas deanei]|eukprot:EPY22046.1 hypothetical protein AGDE_13633 [Angomonas deanei]